MKCHRCGDRLTRRLAGAAGEGVMDNLARLHWEYLVLLARKAPASEIRAAAKAYNDLLDVEFDRLAEAWAVVPGDFLKPKGMV